MIKLLNDMRSDIFKFDVICNSVNYEDIDWNF